MTNNEVINILSSLDKNKPVYFKVDTEFLLDEFMFMYLKNSKVKECTLYFYEDHVFEDRDDILDMFEIEQSATEEEAEAALKNVTTKDVILIEVLV